MVLCVFLQYTAMRYRIGIQTEVSQLFDYYQLSCVPVAICYYQSNHSTRHPVNRLAQDASELTGLFSTLSL